MNIADLFINLGVKGADVTLKAFEGVNKGLGDIASSSLQAKAAILAVLYGLERATSSAAERGQGLQNLSALTSTSIERIQMLENVFRKFGVSAEDVDHTLMGLGSLITKISLNQGLPKYFSTFAQAVGLDNEKLKDKTNGRIYLLNKLQEFSKKASPEIVRELTEGLNLSDNMLAAMIQNYTDLEKYRDKNTLNKGEIKSLRDINSAWLEFWNTLNMIKNHAVAKYGGSLVGGLSNDLKLITDLGSSLMKLAKDFPTIANAAKIAFAAIGIALLPLLGPLQLMSVAVTGILMLLNEVQKYREGKDSLFNASEARKNLEGSTGILDRLKNHKMDILKTSLGDTADAVSGLFGLSPPSAAASVAPSVKPAGATAPQININTNITHHGNAEDTQPVMDKWSDQIHKTVNQMPSRLRHN